jgi:hypothetical protein
MSLIVFYLYHTFLEGVTAASVDVPTDGYHNADNRGNWTVICSRCYFYEFGLKLNKGIYCTSQSRVKFLHCFIFLLKNH